MIKGLTVVGFVMVVFAGALSVFAEPTANEAAVPSAIEESVPAMTTISGEVISIDLVNSCLMVKKVTDVAAGTSEEVKVMITPETKLVKADVDVALTDVAVGSKVTVNSQDGRVVSVEIE